jgi:hypothetical protein
MGRSPLKQRRMARKRSRDIPPAIPSATFTESPPKENAELKRLNISRTNETDLDEDTIRRMLEAAYT